MDDTLAPRLLVLITSFAKKEGEATATTASLPSVVATVLAAGARLDGGDSFLYALALLTAATRPDDRLPHRLLHRTLTLAATMTFGLPLPGGLLPLVHALEKKRKEGHLLPTSAALRVLAACLFRPPLSFGTCASVHDSLRAPAAPYLQWRMTRHGRPSLRGLSTAAAMRATATSTTLVTRTRTKTTRTMWRPSGPRGLRGALGCDPIAPRRAAVALTPRATSPDAAGRPLVRGWPRGP